VSFRALAAAAAAALLLCAGGPAPAPARPARMISVWLPYWSMAAAGSSTLAHASQIGTASPFWYAVSASGMVVPEQGAGNAALVSALRARGMAVVPTVTESAGLQQFDKMLSSPSRRAAVVAALIDIVRQGAYAGLDLDFEQFAIDPSDNQAAAGAAARGYPTFVAEVCRALHSLDRSCTVTVMARTSNAHVLWRGRFATWVYDYTALGAIADRIRIMAYDEHAPDTTPGPVAPYAWVRSVVDYARGAVAPSKVELGIAAFGYIWNPATIGSSTPGSQASDEQPTAENTFTAAEAGSLAAAHHTTPEWSAGAAEERISFGPSGRPTTAWYEDARAELMRARLAFSAGFAGVVLWAAGDETPSFWTGMTTL